MPLSAPGAYPELRHSLAAWERVRSQHAILARHRLGRACETFTISCYCIIFPKFQPRQQYERNLRSPVHHAFQIHSVSLHPVPDRHPGDSKQFGRFGLVAVGFFQGLDEFGPGPVVRALVFLRGRRLPAVRKGRSGHDRGQVAGFNQVVMTGYKGVFKGAFQLPNISRPQVVYDHTQGFVGYARNVFAAFQARPG